MSEFSPATLTLDALRARGEPTLFERDPIAWRERLVAWFEGASGRTLYPDQTEMFLIELTAYAMATAAEEKQAAIVANLGAFAEGRHLDDIAANLGLFRLAAQPAVATIRFAPAELRDVDTLVPAGTRLAAGDLTFATNVDCVIPAGSPGAETRATAEATGARHNDLPAGAVTASLGSIATGLTGANTLPTAGGADREGDERFRLSVVDAPEAFDRRGGWGGYGLAVRRVSPEIVDVAIDRPQPGHIHIVPLTATGAPSEALIDRITVALAPEDQRPHGDQVTVRASQPVIVDLTPTIWHDPTAVTADLGRAIETALRTAFLTLRRPSGAGDRRTRFAPDRGRLGAQIAPGRLVSALVQIPGVVDAALPDLGFRDLPFDQFPQLGKIAPHYVSAADD